MGFSVSYHEVSGAFNQRFIMGADEFFILKFIINIKLRENHSFCHSEIAGMYRDLVMMVCKDIH